VQKSRFSHDYARPGSQRPRACKSRAIRSLLVVRLATCASRCAARAWAKASRKEAPRVEGSNDARAGVRAPPRATRARAGGPLRLLAKWTSWLRPTCGDADWASVLSPHTRPRRPSVGRTMGRWAPGSRLSDRANLQPTAPLECCPFTPVSKLIDVGLVVKQVVGPQRP
jgi:hypothetical protein